MANALTAMSPTYWSRRMGYKLYKANVYRSLANFEEEATLFNGQIVDRQYRSDIVVENYTKGTALTAQDLTATSDQLTVNVIKALLMYIDDIDKIQNKYSAANIWADEGAIRLANAIDARFFYEVINANNTVDDGTIGGTTGNGITVTTSNIYPIFGAINQKLDVQNVPMNDRFFAISPQFRNILWQAIQGKQTMLGDRTAENGNIGEFAGLPLFLTNNLTGEAVWTPGDGLTPTDAETLTINGITFTWKTTIGTTAGNVLAATNMTTSIDNLVALINAGGVTSDSGVSNVSLSTANQRTVQTWVAANVSGTLRVRAMGASYMTVSGSQAADVWTAAKQVQLLMAGRKKSVDCVVQQYPTVKMAETTSAGKIGMNIIPYTLFGVKTFNQGKNELVLVKMRSDNF